MAEKAKASIEEKIVPGNELQKFVSKAVMELKVKRVTLFDKGGAMLLDIPKDNPAYQARAGRFAMPSLVNQLSLIGAKHPEVKVKIERE